MVNSDDYAQFKSGATVDPHLRRILAFIDGKFTVTGEYLVPAETGTDNHIFGFKVFRRN